MYWGMTPLTASEPPWSTFRTTRSLTRLARLECRAMLDWITSSGSWLSTESRADSVRRQPPILPHTVPYTAQPGELKVTLGGQGMLPFLPHDGSLIHEPSSTIFTFLLIKATFQRP